MQLCSLKAKDEKIDFDHLSHDKLTDRQGSGLSTFIAKDIVNLLCRSGFTAVFLFMGGAL